MTLSQSCGKESITCLYIKERIAYFSVQYIMQMDIDSTVKKGQAVSEACSRLHSLNSRTYHIYIYIAMYVMDNNPRLVLHGTLKHLNPGKCDNLIIETISVHREPGV